MAVDSVGGANAVLGQMGTGQSKSLGQKDFLKLMIAQAQNQNPLEPKMNGDFLGQLAQFSTNDGITKMQESIQQLASSLQSNQALQASSLVGRKVLVNSDSVNLDQGEVKAAIELPAAVDNLVASIYSESGELIRKIPLGQHGAGLFAFTWDGQNQKGERMPMGKYTIKVNGIYSGKEVALKTMTAANVDSVSLGQNGEGVKLNVAGVGTVSLNDVKEITN
ncbi:flagellar hook assembly protein FlgD [Legionella micdadei]|uniref:Basal-body rod modification protein FlgD n=1 Tax=Legionella micdadei TaxID=451 RepID=A0A098GDM9_LEGMI|nr:flagellar hook assembly protein FlgD [Legionella micdadei]ARG97790.1 flagellar biosynthesis protein FlgD [Legionella micdadei]ARG99893.1 flagellar biosynthesis protein FlgD [Legionella micdadei]KTD28502.1 flagellar basal body rod modification protein [Legionella micdadei]NSL18729.1 flagellar hook assembly protein FlgD [Legionella micdadei]CEG60608.1 Flagellar basal body rod modification protein FlgD [Legionella micdadei]